MIAFRCRREDELLEALSTGRWPEAIDSELREHVHGCVECSDLLTVADALVDDRRQTESHADLPSSGAVWWRTQLRMEREAREVAARTVERVHGAVIGVTVAAITLILLATSVMKLGWEWLESARLQVSDFASLSSAVPLTVLVAAGIAILVFAPVAVYLAFAKE